jgi:tRNA pseudouridine38-40 synthase
VYRYGAVIGYDGTDFLGFQIQARGRTIQGEFEQALNQVTQTHIRIDGAGRTDAGVHAIGQVVAFNASWQHRLEDLQRALNATLPEDIVVSSLKIVDATFHPRFSALSRSYRYTIVNQSWPNVLYRRYAYLVKKELDLAAMNKASRLLLGEHNFASFGKPPQGKKTVRVVTEAEWSTYNEFLTFNITANAFLYRMVRNLVGTLVEVGLGKLSVDEFKRIMEGLDLARSAAPAPPHGLCLVRVTYPDEIFT